MYDDGESVLDIPPPGATITKMVPWRWTFPRIDQIKLDSWSVKQWFTNGTFEHCKNDLIVISENWFRYHSREVLVSLTVQMFYQQTHTATDLTQIKSKGRCNPWKKDYRLNSSQWGRICSLSTFDPVSGSITAHPKFLEKSHILRQTQCCSSSHGHGSCLAHLLGHHQVIVPSR